MHDLDRVSMQREFENEAFEFEGVGEIDGSSRKEGRRSRGFPLSEAETLELGAELLSTSSEQELEYFLGGVLDRAASAVRGAIDSPTGQAVISALKPVAKVAIPWAGEKIGSAIGGAVSEGAGAPIGGALGRAAGDAAVSALGLELEGLSYEDRELEVAKQVVRLAAATGANAAGAPPEVPPRVVAQVALREAAKQFAPGLLAGQHGSQHHDGSFQTGPGPGGFGSEHAPAGASSGRWFRRGNQIILVGV
jgi:hypothetical protein